MQDKARRQKRLQDGGDPVFQAGGLVDDRGATAAAAAMNQPASKLPAPALAPPQTPASQPATPTQSGLRHKSGLSNFGRLSSAVSRKSKK